MGNHGCFSPAIADETLALAATVLTPGEAQPPDFASALDALTAPICVTDPDGVIVYFNPACVTFAGRVPARGEDRWCVGWKLYSNTGAPLSHDQCPLALTLLGRRAVRGVTAVAERPDGSRVAFMPLPTLIWGRDGELLGAVDMLVDLTDLREIDELLSQASRCRRLAGTVGDQVTVASLNRLAVDYEVEAVAMERSQGLARPFGVA